MVFSLWEKRKAPSKVYRRREPEKNDLYRLVYHNLEALESSWTDRYQEKYGCYRDVVKEAFTHYLDCGILAHGCARAHCENKECNHSELIAFSCKRRGLCPSCAMKRGIIFAETLHEKILKPVPQRHIVFTIPKRLRVYFRYDRKLYKALFKAAWKTLEECLKDLFPDGTAGAVMALESAGSELNFHPHIHSIYTDGVFLPDGSFSPLKNWDSEHLTKLFEHHVFSFLKAEGLIAETTIAQIQSWQTSGFSVWVGSEILADDGEGRLFLSQYLTKNPIMLSRLEIERKDGKDFIHYTSDKDSREFSALDFLAELSAHIPDTFEQTIRYYGVYSARSRGKELKAQGSDSSPSPSLPNINIDPPSRKAVSRSWARLIKRVYEIDPLLCPKSVFARRLRRDSSVGRPRNGPRRRFIVGGCGSTMKIKAFITKPKEITRIMANLGLPNFHRSLAEALRRRPPPPLLSEEKSDLTYWDAA